MFSTYILSMKFDKDERIHFIGVGGISMSALAKYVANNGGAVSGSDRERTACTIDLEKIFPINYGENSTVVDGASKVVYSSAISEDNLELKRARKLKIPTFERHEFLGEISKGFHKTVAVAGTHGKTTVTALVTEGLKNLKADFSAHIGGETELGNLILSGNEIFVTEACEYKQSLLSLNPHVSVLLNAELDHPDCYQDMKSLLGVYLTFLEKGEIQIFSKEFVDICSNEHIYIDGYEKLSKGWKTVETCQNMPKDSVVVLSNGSVKIWQYKNMRNVDGKFMFDVYVDCQYVDVAVTYDEDNITAQNTLVALAVLDGLGYKLNSTKGALKHFKGVKRRRELVGYLGESKVVFDYAHHPTQIRNILSIYQGRRLVVFQPHTYSRTQAYFDDFCIALSLADHLVIMETYGARECVINGADSSCLAEQISTIIAKERVEYIKSTDKTVDYVIKHKNDFDYILFLGAGDIYDLKGKLTPYLN